MEHLKEKIMGTSWRTLGSDEKIIHLNLKVAMTFVMKLWNKSRLL